MYDKYFRATSITPSGTQLTKHKGVMFTALTGCTATFNVLNGAGITESMRINLPASDTKIIPLQIYNIPSLPAGVSAWILN